MNQIPLQLTGALAKSTDKKIKGFLSVNGLDFENDIAAPESFDLKSFLVRGTLLYNHRLWVDEQGNPIPVGKVEDARVVKLVDNEQDPLVWNIKEIETGKIIDTFPKERVPTLVVGDRGVFLVCAVQVDEVWRRILRGMLNGFSWQGTANRVKAKIGKTITTFLNNISMFEASVVFTPQQPESILVPITKAAAMKVKTEEDDNYVIYCLIFSPSVFDQPKASQWLKKRGFQYDENVLVSSDGEWVFPQIDGRFVVKNSERTIRIDEGVQALVGLINDVVTEKDEKNEILLLTEKILGCNLLEKIGDNFMSKKEQLKAVLSKSPDVIVAAEGDVNTVLVAPPNEVLSTPVDAQPVVSEIERDPIVTQEALPAVTEVATETVKIESVSTPVEPVVEVKEVVAELPKVESVASPIDTESADRLVSTISQSIMTVLNEKLSEIVGGLNKNIEQLMTVTSRNAEILVAQAEAVGKLLNPEVQVAKSAVQEVEKVEGESVDTLKTQISELSATVEALKKSAVSDVVRKEHRLAVSKEQSLDVFPKGFLGLSQ